LTSLQRSLADLRRYLAASRSGRINRPRRKPTSLGNNIRNATGRRQDLEAKHPEFTNTIVNTRNLGQDKIDDLKNNRSIGTWSFSYVKPDYTKFCQIMHNARCSKKTDGSGSKTVDECSKKTDGSSNTVDALNLISGLSMDWHPVGGAIINKQKIDPCETRAEYCTISDWNDIEKDIEKPVGNRFGARSFLIKNVELESLDNRYLVDFGNPNQLIPEIGAE
jgi:hypothetical protein